MIIRQIRRPSLFHPQRRARTHFSNLSPRTDEMERLFDDFLSVSRPGFPAINVAGSTDHVVLTASLPGVAPDAIEITVTGQTVTISGERSALEAGEEARWLRRERFAGSFSRSLELPFTIDADNVEASFDSGVLTLTLPQVEAEKPKKITIQTA